MKPLDRLRWKVTAWYVGTFGAILIAFGVGLFFAISHNIGLKLDRSLASAADQVVRNVTRLGAHSVSRDILTQAAGELRIPDRMLYLLDGDGRPIYPDTASAPVRVAALRARVSGSAAVQADIGHEHTLRVHAARFRTMAGDTLLAVAATDTEELEDEFWNLITLFAATMLGALALVGVGGYTLARRDTVPIEQSFEQMRRFMADAAHELRTPVSFLSARADVALQQSREVPEYVEILQEIAAETRRLGVIVNDLFTLARADAGERRVIRQPFFLDDTVLEAANEAGTRATLSGVRLDVKELEEAPVDGDPRLVHQLMSIVLDNAIKYTAPGGEVSLSVTSRAHRSVVIVEDTGIGIPATALSHIYDRFYRADSARPIADGAGLGLSIARWIADVHSANLTISSEPGRGTRVEISFPAGQQNEEQSGGERRPLARVNSGDSDAGGSPVTTVTVV